MWANLIPLWMTFFGSRMSPTKDVIFVHVLPFLSQCLPRSPTSLDKARQAVDNYLHLTCFFTMRCFAFCDFLSNFFLSLTDSLRNVRSRPSPFSTAMCPPSIHFFIQRSSEIFRSAYPCMSHARCLSSSHVKRLFMDFKISPFRKRVDFCSSSCDLRILK